MARDPLRALLDRTRPLFSEGRLARLYPLHEMVDTFLYSVPDAATGAVHVRDGLDLKRMMATVALALAPCVFMACLNTGHQANLALAEAGGDVPGWRGALLAAMGLAPSPDDPLANLAHGALYFLPVFLVTQAVGGLCEAVFAVARGHEINEGFLVTGILYPLTLPPTVPLWQTAVGIAFGVVVGKEVFGGTGRNFLNPALAGRAFIYFAWPADMSGDAVWVAVDGWTQATPLGVAASSGALAAQASVPWGDAFAGFLPGSFGETSTAACLVGAALLVATGVGSFRVMLGVLGGMAALSLPLWAAVPGDHPLALAPWWHLVLGGFAFGAVFMATDPVSGAVTHGGQWIYGALIGAMSVLIRGANPAFPEGVMLAILFANCFAPLIDHFVVRAGAARRRARARA